MKNKGGGDVESRVKEVRKCLGLTQKQVALKSRLSVRGYQRIEAGERRPMVQTAQRIAEALNTTVEELFPACRDANTAGRDISSQYTNFSKKTRK